MAASIPDLHWLDSVTEFPGPYLFLAEGVLVYLPRNEVTAVLAAIAHRFGDTLVGFDTARPMAFQQQHHAAANGCTPARWAWHCRDPREFETPALRLIESRPISKPPPDVRDRLSVPRRVLLHALHPVLKHTFEINLFSATP